MTPKLCLGTAQFGLPYGITNEDGQVPELVVGEILSGASICGINMLDTAQAYGDAQTIVGRNLPPNHSFQVVTKLASQQQQSFSACDIDLWEKDLLVCREQLGINSFDALLLHSSDDLRKRGSEFLEDWLLGLRDRGLVKRLGVSIYTCADLDEVNYEILDLVQLPLSVYDQRLLNDGTITSLSERGISIHARSIYLQGLLLQPLQRWPSWATKEMREHHKALINLSRQKNCRLIDLALGFIKDQILVERVVIGVCNVKELSDLHSSWNSPSPWNQEEWQRWAFSGSDSLDPRNWPK